MKSELEKDDIQAIAHEVVQMIKPLIVVSDEKQDKVFDVSGLAKYLHVDESWIYKQVSLRTIPFFKAGKYTRFRKSVIDKWIDKNMQNPLTSLRFTKGR